MIWLIALAGAAIYSLFAIFVLSLLARLVKACDFQPGCFDDLDLYCPHCDSTDIYDWGEGDWYACHSCRLMFQWPENCP